MPICGIFPISFFRAGHFGSYLFLLGLSYFECFLPLFFLSFFSHITIRIIPITVSFPIMVSPFPITRASLKCLPTPTKYLSVKFPLEVASVTEFFTASLTFFFHLFLGTGLWLYEISWLEILISHGLVCVLSSVTLLFIMPLY